MKKNENIFNNFYRLFKDAIKYKKEMVKKIYKTDATQEKYLETY